MYHCELDSNDSINSQWWWNGGGGLAREAAKQPIIRAKHLHAKVKNWGGLKPP